MSHKLFREMLPLLLILLLITLSGVCVHQTVTNMETRNASLATPIGNWITSGINEVYDPISYNPKIPETHDNIESNTGEGLAFRHYITPEDKLIKSLAARLNDVEDAYRTAVAWMYVSDETLNDSVDKWLTPREFLTGTPHYPANPLQGEAASDCEEQAHTLVSLIRAKSIPAEDVRVVLGKAVFSNIDKGHAWVELLIDGQWIALDPVWGPYWNDQAGSLVERRGMAFNHFTSEEYPTLEIWLYYNDTYYLNPRNGSGNAPSSW